MISEAEIVLLLQAIFTAEVGIFTFFRKKNWLTRCDSTRGKIIDFQEKGIIDFRDTRFHQESPTRARYPVGKKTFMTSMLEACGEAWGGRVFACQIGGSFFAL